MIPCPIGETEPYDVLPTYNKGVIESIEHYVVENLRSGRRFLSAAEVGRPINELHFAELNHHTEPHEMDRLIKPLLEGKDMGMISEAGVPGVADPGAELAMLAHRHGIRVVPLVGPSSILMALMASGLNGQSFAFNGYLPIQKNERVRAIKHFERRAKSENQTQIFIEAPYRNIRLFDDMIESCHPKTLLTVAIDITSPTEYIKTATISDWRQIEQPEMHKVPAIFMIL